MFKIFRSKIFPCTFNIHREMWMSQQTQLDVLEAFLGYHPIHLHFFPWMLSISSDPEEDSSKNQFPKNHHYIYLWASISQLKVSKHWQHGTYQAVDMVHMQCNDLLVQQQCKYFQEFPVTSRIRSIAFINDSLSEFIWQNHDAKCMLSLGPFSSSALLLVMNHELH